MVFLRQLALESVFAHLRAVEFSHNKSIFLYEIRDGFIFIRNPLEPLVLINVTLDNFYLSIQDIPEVDALFKHGQTRQHRWQSAGLEN